MYGNKTSGIWRKQLLFVATDTVILFPKCYIRTSIHPAFFNITHLVRIIIQEITLDDMFFLHVSGKVNTSKGRNHCVFKKIMIYVNRSISNSFWSLCNYSGVSYNYWILYSVQIYKPCGYKNKISACLSYILFLRYN